MWSDLRYRLRALLRRDAMDRELADELRFHVEQAVEKHVRAGVPRREAERRARIEFGGMEQIAEDTRRVRGVAFVDAVVQDLRYAWRGVTTRPGFTIAIVITLGLGIGANAAMFGIVDRMLLRTAAYMDSPELVHRVYRSFLWDGIDRTDRHFAYPTYRHLLEATTSFDAHAAFAYRDLVVGRGAAARELPVAAVSASFFEFFDASPVLGRFFTSEEDVPPAGAALAVLGYGYWRSEYGGSAAVLGEQLSIGEGTYTVVGVAPRGFAGVTDGPAPIAFLPVTAFAYARSPDHADNYGWSWLELLVRRRPDTGIAAASSETGAALARAWDAEREGVPSMPGAAQSRVSALLSPIQLTRGPDAPADGRIATWVLGVAFIVLVIAAANVVNLLLARALHREREIALRLALGVSRRRLVQQLLIETLMLAVLGGLAGLLAARWGGSLLRALFLRVDDVDVMTDTRTLIFTAVLTLAVALLTGLAPALQALRADVSNTLKTGGRAGGFERSAAGTSLLLFQGALCVLLLVGAGLFVRSLLEVRAYRLGYDADALILAEPDLRSAELPDAERDALADRLRAAAASVAGVTHATLAASVPYAFSEQRGAPHVPGRDSLNLLGRYILQVASPDYFATTGTRIVRGRSFAAGDVRGAQPVVIVSRAMAQAIWPDENPLGQQIRFGGDGRPLLTVVGVAEDIATFRQGPQRAFWYYLPIDQYRAMFGAVRPTLLVRAADRPEALVERVRERLQRELPGEAYVRAVPFSQVLEPQQRSWRAGATMFVVFATLALVLAAVGLYSALAYAVAQRRRELGIRIALGASLGNVVTLVVRQGMVFALVSVAVGSAAAVFAAQRARSLLFNASPTDPLVYGSVAALLVVVALLATLEPAVRAARVDPTIPLRED